MNRNFRTCFTYSEAGIDIRSELVSLIECVHNKMARMNLVKKKKKRKKKARKFCSTNEKYAVVRGRSPEVSAPSIASSVPPLLWKAMYHIWVRGTELGLTN